MLRGREGEEMSSYGPDPHIHLPGVLMPETWQILLFLNCLLAKLSGPRASWLSLAR